jgi:hypothetical protein
MEGAFGISKGGLGDDFFRQSNWSENLAGERWGYGSSPAYPSSGGGEDNKDEKLKPGK